MSQMLKLELQICEISKHLFIDIHAWEYNLYPEGSASACFSISSKENGTNK